MGPCRAEDQAWINPGNERKATSFSHSLIEVFRWDWHLFGMYYTYLLETTGDRLSVYVHRHAMSISISISGLLVMGD
jgi:hypothetical protein